MRYALRAVDASDTAFLREVYGSTREDELAPLGWPRAAVDAFLDQQFAAQKKHYDEHYRDARCSVVLVGEKPAGRLYVLRQPGDIRLVDIALLPAFRGSGVGTAMLNDLFDEARASGSFITIHVERDNRARRLYQRLGFVPIAEHGGGVYQLFAWRPDGPRPLSEPSNP